VNEQAIRFFMNQSVRYARSASNEPAVAARKMRAGKICNSCKHGLPEPHTPGSKRCEFCAQRHLVYMYFRRFSGWHCSFRNEARKKLPRELTFKNAETLVELAQRGNGLIDKWDEEGFELDLVIGRGGIWLRLSDEQYRALGGVL
jgi:hypothetical protein